MVDRTDRRCRAALRLLTRRALLYTEMVPTYRSSLELEVELPPDAGPTALQLGDHDPKRLAQAAARAADLGYSEVNLNCGCPAASARDGVYGARLMLEPQRVAAAVEAMRGATSLPVTVKHRLGVDDVDSFEALSRFVDIVADEGGAKAFIVHARKAWLSGLSPKENRTVVPLQPAWVHRLKTLRPELRIEYNGGIQSLAEAMSHLDQGLDGVMIGRAAYDNSWLLAAVDRDVFGDPAEPPTRAEVFEGLVRLCEAHVREGGRVHDIVRHCYGLFRGFAGARAARRALSGAGVGLDVPELRVVLGSVAAEHDPEPTLLPGLKPKGGVGEVLGA